jgi:hypothetical protein
MKKRKKPNPYEKPRERYIPSVKYKRPEFSQFRPKESRLVYLEADLRASQCPSFDGFIVHPNLHTPQLRYEDEEMMKRETAAQEEKKRKSKMVAPLYNKGGYQYVGDAPPEIIKNLGRKV